MDIGGILYISGFIKHWFRHSKADRRDTQTHTDRMKISQNYLKEVG
jgi:hypothetical protein